MHKKKQELQAIQDFAKKDLLSYAVLMDPNYHIAKHHDLAAKHLQDFMQGKTKYLMLLMPPRSGKSRLVTEAISRAFGQQKNIDVLYTGHSLSLLQKFSREIRQRIESVEYTTLFGHTITPGNAGINERSTTNQNSLAIYGVGGGITGAGGDRIFIDDPYANRQQAESRTVRKKVEDRYDSTLYTRRQNDKAGICLIMQRRRTDDLAGYLQNKKDKNRKIVKLPALSKAGRSYRPARFSSSELLSMQKDMGVYFFGSQYQQEPAQKEDGDFVIDRVQYVHEIPEDIEKTVTFLDPAISKKKSADDRAIVTICIGRDTKNVYIKTIVARNDIGAAQTIDALFDIAKKDQPDIVGIETNKEASMVEIRKEKMEAEELFFRTESVHNTTEKEARIRATLQPLYSNKKVYHLADVDNTKLENQLILFPNAPHDDVIDALASAYTLYRKNAASSFFTIIK